MATTGMATPKGKVATKEGIEAKKGDEDKEPARKRPAKAKLAAPSAPSAGKPSTAGPQEPSAPPQGSHDSDLELLDEMPPMPIEMMARIDPPLPRSRLAGEGVGRWGEGRF